MAGQLVLGLSLLVGLHEFGHFAFAKLFKIKVTKFYIFFDFLFQKAEIENVGERKKEVEEDVELRDFNLEKLGEGKVPELVQAH